MAVLHTNVLPLYCTLDLPVKAVLTDGGGKFCGTYRHPFELHIKPSSTAARR